MGRRASGAVPESGAVSAKTPPPSSKVSCTVDERNDNDLFDGYPIDETVISNEQLTVLIPSQFWHPAAALRQVRERLRRFQKIGNEPGSS